MTKVTPVNLWVSSVVIAVLLAISATLQLVFGSINNSLIAFPQNMLLLIELIVIQILLFVFFKKTKIISWLSSPSASISSMLLFSLWVIVMAIIPQQKEIPIFLGLNDVVYTWMFAVSSFYLVLILGFVTLKRIFPFKLKNVQFFINHFGLWIVIVAGLLGAADKKELIMQVYEGQTIWFGQNNKGEIEELPLAVKLIDFVVKSHPPKIMLVDSLFNPIKGQKNQPVEIEKNLSLTLNDYQIQIKDYYPEATWNGVKFISTPGMEGCMPAIKVDIKNSNINKKDIWLSSGNYLQSPMVYSFSDNLLLTLLPPEPSYFGSKVILYSKTESNASEEIISVNKPAHCEGWTIYQYSYDGKLGNDSPYSVFKLVKDPWLPLVYIGFFMMMLGAMLMMLTKVISKSKEDKQ